MPLNTKRLTNDPEKFLGSLKTLQKNDAPDKVHKFRTRIRRLEATLLALQPDARNATRLLRMMKPLRKRAGKVRDMDVLTGIASRHLLPQESECSAQLLEFLGSRRVRQSGKLHRVARELRPELNERFRQWDRKLRKVLAPESAAQMERWAASAAVYALELESELRNWPALGRDNLHRFRLKVKELRHVLQLSPDSGTDFIPLLGRVKDAIGNWHDCQELAHFAGGVIAHPHCKLLKEIRLESARQLRNALALANRLKTKYLPDDRGRHGKKSALRGGMIALRSASQLVA